MPDDIDTAAAARIRFVFSGGSSSDPKPPRREQGTSVDSWFPAT
jgi:hypothetical protein